jgi:putative lipoprotein
MIRLATFFLLVGISACSAQEPEAASEDPVAREQELAKNDVWHAAKLRGVAFRAIGQEPGWMLEITIGEEILVVTNYGEAKESYAYVEPQEDKAASKTVFQLDVDTRILIEGKLCADSMSGESFEVTVTLTIGAKTLKGCGRALF